MEQILLQLLNNPSGLLDLLTLPIIISALLRIWNVQLVRERLFGWVKRWPRRLQPVAPVVIAMIVTGCESYQSGLRGQPLALAILAVGGISGGLAIGIYDLGKSGWALLLKLWALVKRSPQTTTAVVLVGLAGSLQACAGSFETARLRAPQTAQVRELGATSSSPSRCESLDDRQMWGSTAAIVFASASGLSGLSTVKVDDDDRGWRYGIATSAVLAAALAAGSEVYAQSARSSYLEEGCAQ